jgi:predicted anti-sigma-YlaC factor YlaD
MKCDKYQKMISDRLDGELSRRKGKRLDRHLAACPLCRDYLKSLEIIQGEVLKADKVNFPQERWPEFEQVLQEKLRLGPGNQQIILRLKKISLARTGKKRIKARIKAGFFVRRWCGP